MINLKYFFAVILCFWIANSFAQKSNKFIQIQLNDYQSYKINNYGRMTFKMGTAESIKSKIYIVNDSQFLLINSFNELSEDTLNIRNISEVKVRVGGQNFTRDPALTAVLVLVLWPVAVPYLIYKLIDNDSKKWVKRDNYTIAIYNN